MRGGKTGARQKGFLKSTHVYLPIRLIADLKEGARRAGVTMSHYVVSLLRSHPELHSHEVLMPDLDHNPDEPTPPA